MKINKNISFDKIQKGLEALEKIRKNTNIENLSFNGSIDKENKRENFSINWVEEEEIK